MCSGEQDITALGAEGAGWSALAAAPPDPGT
jgi:hypothetical protein